MHAIPNVGMGWETGRRRREYPERDTRCPILKGPPLSPGKEKQAMQGIMVMPLSPGWSGRFRYHNLLASYITLAYYWFQRGIAPHCACSCSIGRCMLIILHSARVAQTISPYTSWTPSVIILSRLVLKERSGFLLHTA